MRARTMAPGERIMNMKGVMILFLPLLLYFLTSFIPTVFGSLSLYNFCTNTNAYSSNSAFGANLNTLLSALSNATTATGFYSSTAGNSSSDRVYGLFLCRGDVSTEACRLCVANASVDIVNLCPTQREAIVWYDYCLLRYSNQSVFSNQGLVYLSNTQDIDTSSLAQFKEVLDETMGDIANQAARNQSGRKFASKDANFSGDQKVYTLAQCTEDFSVSDCNSCLADAISRLPDCCEGKQGGRVLKSSCNVRYEIYPFYYLSDTASPPPPASSPPPSAPANSPVSPSDPCKECLMKAILDMVVRCGQQGEADDCQFRFSNKSASGFSKNIDISINSRDINASSKTEFDRVLGDTLRDVANQAATSDQSDSTGNKFFTKTASFGTGIQKLYTRAECMPYLTISDCNSCLADAILELPACCEGKRGARVVTSFCNVRYETYPFYDQNSAAPPTESADPHPPTSPKSPGNKGSKRRTIIMATTISGFAMLLAVGVLGSYIHKSKSKRREKGPAGGMVDQNYDTTTQTESSHFPTIQLDLILTATAHFSDENKLGEGGFGPVYKGTLPDGREVAVKRLSRTSHQGLQEFLNEVTMIAKLQHWNLVKLFGCCLEGNESLLIYEYMPNKSLDVWLFDSSKSVGLDWKKRILIINGIARGILYLHEDSRLKIIHRDLKASNILLDDKMNPKISDFGMARIFGRDQNQANTGRVVGTYGYMAPEYAMEGLFSVKSDVFSFGVLLLEIISGKRNNGFHLSVNGHSLLTFAWELWFKGQALELVDPLLTHSSHLTEVLKCIHIGLLCVQKDPTVRPTMSSIVVILASNNMVLPQPTEPAFSMGRLVLRSTLRTSSVNEVSLSDILPR
ncbi:cysteine-rich receptor-like protein kinase 25 isoform X3 [Diospyros lotus]|uniref:cysteine-rich receptor-like protein kinase 25 isoform X3 n=1 Tax=Diospyros lotus TaxID=55363 RepID=UPI00224F85B8|nr:cysteine-rich receptor-like protein kinase 25 isoform X3 [Diospyros lotus]